tara:strand:- start:210 stop:572 length:363 start_codon:yes stop_codon:yes gene_type:complete
MASANQPEWLKFLDEDLRKKPLVPTEALTNALRNMPAEHRDRPGLQATLDRMLRMREKDDGSVRVMQAGGVFKLKGLEENHDLNGVTVTLQAWMQAKQRWSCVTSCGRLIHARPKNLAPA